MKIRQITAAMACALVIAGEAATAACAAERWNGNMEGRNAIESGADWIELDVGVTKDGVLVVLHDEDLKRVAGDSRKIGELTFEEVRRLDVGSSFGPDFRGVGIPSLEEVLDYCQGRVLLNIEIKYRKGQDLAFIPRLVDRMVIGEQLDVHQVG